MARLQKKHSSKDKNKKRESKSSIEDKNAKNVLSTTKKTSSSVIKGSVVKSSNPSNEKKNNMFKQGVEYLQEVQSELKKVTWPNRNTILNHSARVFGFILILSFFFILDRKSVV